jgi:hypothetical protein
MDLRCVSKDQREERSTRDFDSKRVTKRWQAINVVGWELVAS